MRRAASRWRGRTWVGSGIGLVIVLGGLALLAGCADVGYYWQSASGHLNIMRAARPVPEVLEHIVTGRLNKQIAAALGTVEQTVKIHRARVMSKMKVRSVAELVRVVAEFKSAGVPLR